MFPAFVVAMADPKAVLEVFRAVEEEGLDLHVAVFAEDRAVVEASGVVKARQVSGSKNYIGLRESPEDALQRGQQSVQRNRKGGKANGGSSHSLFQCRSWSFHQEMCWR